MKVQTVVMVTGCSAWMWSAAAAPESSPAATLTAPVKSLETLILDLSDERFRVREEATRKVWEIGDSALPALQQAATGKDPEQAYRARELIRKIELHITPDTDPSVIKLVERYAKASANEKMALFDQMHKQRAWRQILKLYASETSPDLQTRLKRMVDGVAVTGARESILKGDPKTARELLEMAPADATGLLALADFHRSQGTFDAELARAKTLDGPKSDAWQLALYRAVGNIEAARDAASAAGEVRISAAMAMLAGDPVPMMRKNRTNDEGMRVHKPYADLAIRRWQGFPLRASDLEALERSVNSKNPGEVQNGINSLFLLGETQRAEAAYLKNPAQELFVYFESQERIPEALRALGLDPAKPDYSGWVEKRIIELSGDEEVEEEQESSGTSDLLIIADFLERRGLHRECEDAFFKPLIALAEKDEKVFMEFLGELFGGGQPAGGSPKIATRVAVEWAGDQEKRWDELLNVAFGGETEIIALWDWMAELDPKISRAERLEGMFALRGMGRDPRQLRKKWLDRQWEIIAKTPAEKRKPLVDKMIFLTGLSSDLENSLKARDLLVDKDAIELFNQSNIMILPATGQWDAAAEFFLNQIEQIAKLKQDPRPSFHACAASCLRRAGRIAEANEQDGLAEKLSLGNDAFEIGNGYAYGEDFTRASMWFARAACQTDPSSGEFAQVLGFHGEALLGNAEWKGAGAIFEVLAHMAASVDSGGGNPAARLKIRLQADLGRALANLKTDRAGSIAILENCHRMFPSDGSLADYFFPAVRKMGLIKEHDGWFKISWERMSEVIETYPDSDNTLNTAGWLASRAQRNLPQAEEYLNKALTLNPEQSAYLDTMAEIQFASGRRAKALEWSSQAINFTPEDQMLRRQREHFRSDPMPR